MPSGRHSITHPTIDTSTSLMHLINQPGCIRYAQQVRYQDMAAWQACIKQLAKKPAIISAQTIYQLHEQLEQVLKQHALLLHIGDCAEGFADATEAITQKKSQHFIQMKNLLAQGSLMPVVLIARIAGQYVKPRSQIWEMCAGEYLPVYRGDMINAHQANKQARQPDPQRLLLGYQCAKRIWEDLEHISAPLFISHECSVLEYETALTRSVNGLYYNLSTHYPWLGVRTLHSNWHHRYLSLIQNPIAFKINADSDVQRLLMHIRQCNPLNLPGRISLITRMGRAISHKLPIVLQAIKENKLSVIWVSDPMHANTQLDHCGLKYRLLADIFQEISESVRIHKAHNSHLAGLHLETSYEEGLEECIDDKKQLKRTRYYKSLLDPRLNQGQSLQVIKYFIHCLSE